MVNPVLLKQLRQAVSVDDWILSADICLEIALSAQDELDRERADKLAKEIRLQDSGAVAAIIAEMEA